MQRPPEYGGLLILATQCTRSEGSGRAGEEILLPFQELLCAPILDFELLRRLRAADDVLSCGLVEKEGKLRSSHLYDTGGFREIGRRGVDESVRLEIGEGREEGMDHRL